MVSTCTKDRKVESTKGKQTSETDARIKEARAAKPTSTIPAPTEDARATNTSIIPACTEDARANSPTTTHSNQSAFPRTCQEPQDTRPTSSIT